MRFVRRMRGLSSSQVVFSWLVMKYGERYPRSIWAPSTCSRDEAKVRDSSTEMTPSLPTSLYAFAIMSPIWASPFAEIVPTCATCSSPTGTTIFASSSTTRPTARSIPSFSSVALYFAARSMIPCWRMEWASTVAPVVPSPASSAVLAAASLMDCTPRS